VKVGDLVRKVVGDGYIASAVVPLKCFGIVVVEPRRATKQRLGRLAKVDFGDYGVFWMLPHEIELLS